MQRGGGGRLLRLLLVGLRALDGLEFQGCLWNLTREFSWPGRGSTGCATVPSFFFAPSSSPPGALTSYLTGAPEMVALEAFCFSGSRRSA